MRILALGMHATADGELSYEARSIHHIAKMGHHVDYWTDNPLDYGMETVLQKPETLRNFMFHEGAKALARTPRQFAPEDLKKIIAQHKLDPEDPYDVIYSTATTGIDMGVFLKRLLGIPLVVQWLDVPYWRIDPMLNDEIYKHSPMHLPLLPREMFDGYQKEWAYWFSNLPSIDLVSTILQVTKGQLLEYAQRFGVPLAPEKVHVTYHGSIDADTLGEIINREKVEKKNQVICVNRIDFHKGVDQTVMVAKMIQDALPADPPEFVFVSRGNAEWYENLVKTGAQSLLKKFRFTGWVDNTTKFRLIRESKVMLDCEWPEGFGGCNIGEAIYCDCVPIVWDRKSKKECYPTGAVRVPLDDYNSMAEAAVKTLKGEFGIGDEDRRFVREFRSIESHAKGLVEAFEKVVR